MNTDQSAVKFAPSLDDILTPAQCADWLQMTPSDLVKKSKGLKPVIPSCALGFKTRRYHPRTILAKMAADSGVSLQIIAASYGVQPEPKN